MSWRSARRVRLPASSFAPIIEMEAQAMVNAVLALLVCAAAAAAVRERMQRRRYQQSPAG